MAPADCAPARDEDFEGPGEASLRGYLAHLVRTYGDEAGLGAHEVTLAIVRGPPKPTMAGVAGGEVSCAVGYGPPYRVTLYRDALVGRPLALVYGVVAHEFRHAVQIRRDALPCGADGGWREAYERDAAEFAARAAAGCGALSDAAP